MEHGSLTSGEAYERDMGQIAEAIRRVKDATGAQRVRLLVGPDARWSPEQISRELRHPAERADVRGVEVHPA